jgi:abortive infection bacteriophage resistance protein
MNPPTPFPKPALNLAQQIGQLLGRGLIISDRQKAEHYLKFVGYFRLKVYTRFFEHPEAGTNKPVHFLREGTTFDDVWNLYVFDRELRLLILDAIERIEVALRSIVSNTMCERFGSHWFMEKKHFVSESYHQSLLELIAQEAGRYAQGEKRKGLAEFLVHYFDCNYVEELPPAWMLCEVLSFSTWSKIYSNLADATIKKQVATHFKIHPLAFASWVHALSHLRNICAHHNYCWNRRFTITPSAVWIDGAYLKQTQTLYPFTFIIHRFLEAIAPGSTWKSRLHSLFEANSDIPISEMGFPSNWREMKDWR